MKLLRRHICALSLALPFAASAGTIDVVDFFASLHGTANAAVFPVGPGSLDDIESAFGPREQTSTGNYDWHRGFDVDGTDMVDSIVTALDGYFYDYRFSARGGYTVIIEHHFADFTTDTVTFHGTTVTKFYTWHLHLWDDGNEGNATSTDDIVSGYTAGDPISRGTQIGILSNSGSSGGSPYAPHLHYELRIGTNSSLEYQLDNNPGTTQWGFDPHVNPMLLFDAGSTSQSLSLNSGTVGSDDLVFDLTVNDDDYPIFNALSVLIRDANTLAEITSHTLDYNLRTGFDASDVDDLDTQTTSLPYVEPLTTPFTGSIWSTQFIVPHSWISPYLDQGYELVLTATDIWGTSVSANVLSLTAVPEPASVALLLGGLAFAASCLRRRSRA